MRSTEARFPVALPADSFQRWVKWPLCRDDNADFRLTFPSNITMLT
ncbi:hypothetical protein XBI1_2920038 [Xenorhabdus bovienii str. Intermedium]|uniref:Uncharacterized protein n=1 Tax=Xenorhabdus bovienii str. Intermedium TaxID=1379677 RepID=A0A077QLJ0_XENBV|nr:hypothetical protein XBI1_2920038 [Xenorhabdus bovienii str. Intermedium]